LLSFHPSHRRAATQNGASRESLTILQSFKLPFALNWKPQGIDAKEKTDNRNFSRVVTSRNNVKLLENTVRRGSTA